MSPIIRETLSSIELYRHFNPSEDPDFQILESLPSLVGTRIPEQ